MEVATAVLNLGEESVKNLFYVNSEIALRAQENPRLWELPDDWESYTYTYGLLWFRNTRTLDDFWKDPRLTSDELCKHGVTLQTYQLT